MGTSPPDVEEGELYAGRVLVEDDGRRRPFMRGIMIHSLMERGVAFEDAYKTANAVRERIAGRTVITNRELAAAVRELLGDLGLESVAPAGLVEIAVTGEGRATPFSKGILSQSLLAAALDPGDAFDAARAIERQLQARGRRAIARRELRRLIYETLTERSDSQAAERYLVWRRHQQPGRPVFILLGGTSGVGKTSLALEVAHRLAIGRVLSTDSIRQIMRIMLSHELMPALHASSFDAHRVLPEGPEGPEGGSRVVEGFLAQAAAVSVGIRASMDRAVAENTNLVLDGVSVVPGMIDLDAYAELAHVIFLMVAVLDDSSFGERFAARAEGAHQRPPHLYIQNLDAILEIQDFLLEQADRHQVPIVDNSSFDRSVLLTIRHVTDTLRAREDFDVEKLL